MKDKHNLVLIAVSEADHSNIDKWYWCLKCGALSLNKKEYWKAGNPSDLAHKGALKGGVTHLKCTRD
jgi:hypothetical protein